MTEMPLPLAAGALAALLLAMQSLFMLQTGLGRRASGIGWGEGEGPDLKRAMRRHGNLAENAGVLIAGLALAELLGAPPAFAWGAAALAGAARLAHAASMAQALAGEGPQAKPRFLLRLTGAVGTGTAGILIAAAILWSLAQ